MTDFPIQIIAVIVSIFGSGLSVFIGMRIASTENRKDIQYQAKEIARLEAELSRTKEDFHKFKERFLK